jgi:hypothetical protein
LSSSSSRLRLVPFLGAFAAAIVGIGNAEADNEGWKVTIGRPQHYICSLLETPSDDLGAT